MTREQLQKAQELLARRDELIAFRSDYVGPTACLRSEKSVRVGRTHESILLSDDEVACAMSALVGAITKELEDLGIELTEATHG